MPGDPVLPPRAWDFPPWQAACLVSGAAQAAERAWAKPVPIDVILDVSWDLHQAFRDLGITLRRLSRLQRNTGPDRPPRTGLHEPGSHIYRAGSAAMDAGAALRDREVLQHVRRAIALGRPAGGDPEQGPAAITAALELAGSAVIACRIVGTSPSGTAADRDAAVGAFMRAVDNLDAAVENLARRVNGPHTARLSAVRTGLEQGYTDLQETLICSAVDFRRPGSGRQVLAMRERYPVLPHRSPLAQDARTPTPPGSPRPTSRQSPGQSPSEPQTPRRRGRRRPLPAGRRFSPDRTVHADRRRENHRTAPNRRTR